MTEKKESVFETLSKIDVSGHIEKKMGLSYLSWAWAWQTVKDIYPDTPNPKPTKYQEMLITKDGYKLTERKVPYLTTPTGTIVEMTVTIKGVDYTQQLYVMDNKNKSVVNPTQAQINKTTQRCIVKALAMAGLGLNLYAGEDLPMGDISEQDKKKQEALEKAKQAKEKADQEKNEKLNQQYRELIDKSVETTGKDVVTIEEGIKKLAKSKQPNFDSLSNAVRKSILIEILQQTLKKHETTEQQGLEEVS